jgi:HEAT repeat protein
MKRMLRISAAVLAGLGVLAAGTWILSRAIGDHRSLYRGRSIYYWSEQLTNHDAAASSRAATVLNSRIIPHLTNEIFSDTNDSKLKLAIIARLNTLPGIEVEFIGADGRRARAVNDLGIFGPKAKGAAPALLVALKGKDEVLYCPAASSLARIQADPEATVPALIGRLVDRRGRGRSEVVEALGEYGPRAKAAVPALVKMLRDRSSRELIKVVPVALKQIDPEAAAAAGVPK